MPTTETPETHLLNLFRRLRSLPVLHIPEDVDLSPPAFFLLNWVSRSPGCGVLDIAKGMRLAPPTISVGTHRLVKAGWLERRQDPQDRRGKPLFLTPEGQGLIDHVKQHRSRMLKLFLSGMTPDEQEQFLSLLEKAITAMEASLENDN
ncbi:MAG: MarR family transcriptional regulator [Chloroflexi bacterium]|nr:MarR family transcriptional regulator [Chloroflexota bacterium]